LKIVFTLACWGIITYVLIDLLLVGSRVYKGKFPFVPVPHQRQENFRQINSTYDRQGEYPAMYLPVLNNEGVNNGNTYSPIDWQPLTVASYGSIQYRGEAYLLNSRGTATITSWSPNRLIIQIDLPEGQEDTLVINQRMLPGWGWKAEDGRTVMPLNFLISSKVTGRDKEVVLVYRPWSVWLGGLVSCLGFGLGAVVWHRGLSAWIRARVLAAYYY
jgi:hypothetical protein